MATRRITQARSLRQRSGLAEQKIWALLRGGRIDGHKFRRQHPIGRYIADFACEPLRLVIEVDGGVHQLDDVAVRDHIRQVDLEAAGWTVIRFTNDAALADPHRVVTAIQAHARLIRS